MSRLPLLTTPKQRVLARIVLCVALATLAGIVSISSISVMPPGFKFRSLDIAGAGARVVVDNPRSLVSDRLATGGDYQTLQKRTVLLGNLMASQPVRERIARLAGVDPDDLTATARLTTPVQAAFTDPGTERRATEIRESRAPYRLEVHPDPTLPALSLYSQAPTVREAERIADAAVPAVRAALRAAAVRERVDPDRQVVMEQPGPARGRIINRGARVVVFGVTFVLVLSAAAFVLLLLRYLRLEPQRLARPRPAPLPAPPLGRGVTPAVGRTIGDWPRTTRVLPWMIAAMMAIFWLVPFNSIELSYSLPIDLKFDRLVLPFVALTWVLAVAAGGTGAPRVRLTWIHFGVGAVAITALLSIALEASSLNRDLELETSVKQLTLLASYISLFVIVASSVRRSETRAFLKLTLVLGVMCALGTIWEYRFQYNVFYSMSQTLLPSIFTVGEAESSAVDSIGRRLVRGPGAVSLEAVTMLAMGLPIAMVGLLRSKVTRTRVLYALAAAIILAATVSTERKTALLAPASVFVTLACFRRRELLRLAPVGLVMGVLILALTPGAAQSVVAQVGGTKLDSVPTVSDRTSDYDAVRPDVLAHLAFGRGFGSFKPPAHRVLDMELLGTLVQVGAVGLLAFLGMAGTVVATARRPIRERRAHDAELALSAASAAVVLLVVAALFDVMSFPHCPYIALSLAGLLAVIVSEPSQERRGAWS